MAVWSICNKDETPLELSVLQCEILFHTPVLADTNGQLYQSAMCPFTAITVPWLELILQTSKTIASYCTINLKCDLTFMLPLMTVYKSRKATALSKKLNIDFILSLGPAKWMPVESVRLKASTEQHFLLWKLYPDHCIEGQADQICSMK